jgi:hypothetical protein
MVRLVPSMKIKTRVELLVNHLDEAGLDVTGETWSTPSPGKLLITEAVWPALRSIVIDQAQQGKQSVKGNGYWKNSQR